MKKIFSDNHSSTKIDPLVLKTMLPYFSEKYGNSGSLHSMGQDARDAIEHSRQQVATLIGAHPDNIFFTNSATEANNILIQQNWYGGILTTNTEHVSVLTTAKVSNMKKYFIFKAEKDGTIDMVKLKKIIQSKKPSLVSIIAANNEIGTIHDIANIGSLCKLSPNAIFHTDASQAIGKIDINVHTMNISALTISGHKIHGPKGIGALYVEDPSRLGPLTHGGYQNQFISGTQNTPAIVGLGMACALLITGDDKREERNKKIGELRDMLLDNLLSKIKGSYVNGTMKNRLTNNINIVIPNVEGRALAMALGNNGVMISGGSACNSLNPKPSYVLKAIGCPNPESAIRISLSKFTTEEEIIKAGKQIVKLAKKMKK